MGSVPSTPDSTDDPWWPIENQNFSLDQSPLLNVVAMDQQGQSAAAVAINETDRNGESSEVDHSENLNNDSQSENCSDAENNKKVDNVERKEQTLEEFKEELRIKREKRQNAIADLRNEIKSLRQQLSEEKELNNQLRRVNTYDTSTYSETLENEDGDGTADESVHGTSNIRLKRELANVQLSLQLANSEVLSLQAELNVREKQTDTLKEVNAVSKQMIQIREDQLNQVNIKNEKTEKKFTNRTSRVFPDACKIENNRRFTS